VVIKLLILGLAEHSALHPEFELAATPVAHAMLTQSSHPLAATTHQLRVHRLLTMPVASKQVHMLEEVTNHHIQQKRAHVKHMVSELLNDLVSSDTQSSTDTSSSPSSPSISSPSPASSDSGSSLLTTHSGYSPSDSEDVDANDL